MKTNKKHLFTGKDMVASHLTLQPVIINCRIYNCLNKTKYDIIDNI